MERAFVKIRGIVQGVGFRPFVHKEVSRLGLSGYIKNSSSGVELELEGESSAITGFLSSLNERAPALALIESIENERGLPPLGYSGFEIRSSKTERKRDTLISPDICVCDNCLAEMKNPSDRRYKYPFINCTNCGPRFTIIRDLPYDRQFTSMASFPMCPACHEEYSDISDRRYHAQPDCCPDCGPHVFFLDEHGEEIPGDPIENARDFLRRGKIVAVKGLGGIHLACLSDDEALVRELRRRKHRDEKPFALMCRDVAAAEELCFISDAERRLLESPRRPIVLLEKRDKGAPSAVSDNSRIGFMLPYTPLHYLLFGEDFRRLLMTSANLSDMPIISSNTEALTRLSGIADAFLLHNRDIQTRCDDSLCWALNGGEYFARRSRGYVPFPLKLHTELRPILACGAEQKASFCLSRGEHAFPSQHIGDLKNAETLEYYSAQISHLSRMFDIFPSACACDMHPDYLSSDYAARLCAREDIPLIPVQHHHAHMASCMADNSLEGELIALVWDGTGLGTDGTTWGAECLIGAYGGFRRFGSIRPLPLPGGDRAIKEPDRQAFSALYLSGCSTEHIPGAAFYAQMLAKDLNCPPSSGMGRLFDAVSAILGIRHTAGYEGQGAILLEAAASADVLGCPPEFYYDGGIMRYDWIPLIRALNAGLEAGVPVPELAGRFMSSLVLMAVEQCLAAYRETGLRRVCLSGGSFQNIFLAKTLPPALEAVGLECYTHRRVSANDEGVSLGQLMVADSKLKAL